MPDYRIHHHTSYCYSQPVSLSHHVAHLIPRLAPRQACHAQQIEISPSPRFRKERRTYFGNLQLYFSIHESHQQLDIRSTLEISVKPPANPPQSSAPWESVISQLEASRSESALEAHLCSIASTHAPITPEALDYALPSFPKGRPILEAAKDLTQRIFGDFTFDTSATTVSTPIAQTLETRRGVCRDFAHLQIACLRSLGLPARYVSGYILSRPEGAACDLAGADASHAWLSLYCGEETGWVDLDPTNNAIPSIHHITLAWGRDFSDVSPIRGVTLGGGEHSLRVAVDVIRADSPPQ